MATKMGRGVEGKRGIGTGKHSEATNTSKPGAAASGIKKSQGDGLGSKSGKGSKGGKY